MRYAEEVMRGNRVLNLTGARNAEAFLEALVYPSLRLGVWLPEEGLLVDVGSGNGVPGVPLLLRFPGLRGVFVERRQKRAAFLKRLVRVLDLPAEVRAADIEALDPLGADAFVARAVAPEAKMLAWAAKHLRAGGVAAWIVPRNADPQPQPGWTLVADCCEAGLRMRAWRKEGCFT